MAYPALLLALAIAWLATSAAAQTQAQDCAPFEALFRQSSIALPWTTGSCCSQTAGFPNTVPSFNCSGGRVTGAALSHMKLSGTIPDLAAASQLTFILLSYNSLSGPIPPSVSSLTQLTVLDLDNNFLEGAIPPLPALVQTLYVDHNSLTGNVDGLIPQNVAECSLTASGTNPGLFTCGGSVPTKCGTLPRGTAAQCAGQSSATTAGASAAPSTAGTSAAPSTTGTTGAAQSTPPPGTGTSTSTSRTSPTPSLKAASTEPPSPGPPVAIIAGGAAGGAVALGLVALAGYLLLRRPATSKGQPDRHLLSPDGSSVAAGSSVAPGSPISSAGVPAQWDSPRTLPLPAAAGPANLAAAGAWPAPASPRLPATSPPPSPLALPGPATPQGAPGAHLAAPYPPSVLSGSGYGSDDTGTVPRAVAASPGSEEPHWIYVLLVGRQNAVNHWTEIPESVPPVQVEYEFVPGRDDEVHCRPGDLIKLQMAYRDGWALGVNVTTWRTGVLPLDHLRIGSGAGGAEMARSTPLASVRRESTRGPARAGGV